jgi:bifunctional DNA-binding transcriptional regulator/antitoxin component of YhaV-PrlF toxin-antitoxin module
MVKNKIWTTVVEEDPENPESYVITFPDEVIAEAGWQVGDTLIWCLREDGAIVLTKKKDNGQV